MKQPAVLDFTADGGAVVRGQKGTGHFCPCVDSLSETC